MKLCFRLAILGQEFYFGSKPEVADEDDVVGSTSQAELFGFGKAENDPYADYFENPMSPEIP